jgi:hypothetical protein
LRIWVFIQENVWIEKQPEPLGRRVMGMGWEQVEKQVVEALTHKEATGKCVREYGFYWGEESELLHGKNQTTVFQVSVSFPLPV